MKYILPLLLILTIIGAETSHSCGLLSRMRANKQAMSQGGFSQGGGNYQMVTSCANGSCTTMAVPMNSFAYSSPSFAYSSPSFATYYQQPTYKLAIPPTMRVETSSPNSGFFQSAPVQMNCVNGICTPMTEVATANVVKAVKTDQKAVKTVCDCVNCDCVNCDCPFRKKEKEDTANAVKDLVNQIAATEAVISQVQGKALGTEDQLVKTSTEEILIQCSLD
jgi:hypothetical protein